MGYGQKQIVDVSEDNAFSRNVAKILGVTPHRVTVKQFPDTDVHVTIDDSVRGQDVFLFQHYTPPVRESYSILTDAAYAAQQGGKARRISVVTPYCFGARGERATRSREAVPVIKVAREYRAAGIDNVITMGLHAEAVPSIFSAESVNVEHLPFEDLVANHIIRTAQTNGYDRVAIASPDLGGSKRLEKLDKILDREANGLVGELVFGRKLRNGIGSITHKGFVGDVKDQVVFLYDDIGDTLGTLQGVATALKEGGARELYIVLIHPVLGTPSDPAKEGYRERLERFCNDDFVSEIVFSNTIPLPTDASVYEKVRTIPIEPFFAEAIRRVNADKSMSELRSYRNIMSIYDSCPVEFNGKHVPIGTINTTHKT